MATNRGVVSLEVEKAESELLRAIRFAREDVKRPQTSGRLRNLAGDVLSRDIPRSFDIRAMLCLLRDAFERGSDEAHLQEVAASLSKAIRSWYAAQEQAVENFDAAHVAEEEVESEQDVAEAKFRLNPNGATLHTLEVASRKHTIKSKKQIEAARALVYGQAS